MCPYRLMTALLEGNVLTWPVASYIGTESMICFLFGMDFNMDVSMVMCSKTSIKT